MRAGRRVAVGIGAAVLGLLGIGCGGGAALVEESMEGRETVPAATASSPEDDATSEHGDGATQDEDRDDGGEEDERRAEADQIDELVGAAIAYVETPTSTGSGVLVEGGLVLTNAHVVDPFDRVFLMVGGEELDDVPVIGVDARADIAVLGPIDVSAPPLRLVDDRKAAEGTDVHLVGYPGGFSDTVTVSSGHLLEPRPLPEYGQLYLQTDATIEDGQSGGALVDSRGGVLGISGLGDDQYALALSSEDVLESVALITAGRGTTRPTFPEPGEGARTGSLSLAGPDTEGVLAFESGRDDETIRLTLPPDLSPAVRVADLWGEILFVNQEAADQFGGSQGTGFDGPVEVADEVEPGVFDFDVPAYTLGFIVVGGVEATTLPYEASVPVVPIPDSDERRRIGVGDRVEGAMGGLEQSDTFVLDLDQGQTVRITVGSPSGGDMGFSIVAPGQVEADARFVDDSGIGLLDLDASRVFTASDAGPHVIDLFSWDVAITGYVIEVQAA